MDNGSTAPGIDHPRAGLPAEFVESVFAGAFMPEEGAALGSGMLCFNRAAYNLTGSSPIVFRWLAHAVVRLIRSAEKQDAEEYLLQLLQLEASPSL
jgi:hypothetical protein